MNEQQAQELFNQLYNDGYDVADLKTFKSALQNPEKAKELYGFFTKEGYDLGPQEGFLLGESNDPKLDSKSGVADEQPTDRGVDNQPPPDFVMPDNAPSVTEALELNKQHQDKREGSASTLDNAYDPNAYEAPVLTSQERSVLDEGSGIQKTVSERSGEVVQKFGWADESQAQLIQDWVNEQPASIQARFAEGEWDEMRAATIAERAYNSRLGTLAEDMNVLADRIKADYSQNESNALVKARIEISTLPPDQQEAALEEFNNTLPNDGLALAIDDYYKLGVESQKLRGDYTDIITKYPEEASRRFKVQSGSNLDVKETDTWGQAVGKTFFNSGFTASNRILQFGQNMLNGGAVIGNVAMDVAETGLEVVGQDTQLGGSDDFGRLDKFVDTYSREITKMLLPENSGVYKDGEFQGFDNLVSGIAGTMTDMALLLGGGELASGGILGTMMVSGTMTAGQAYQEAIDKGLSESEAQKFAVIKGTVEGSLEALSPQQFTKGLFNKKNIDELLGIMAKEKLSAQDVTKFLLQEGLQENVQEFAQMIGEKTVNSYTNAALGTDFEEEYTSDEIKETAILTTASSLLMAGLAAGKNLNDQQTRAAAVLSERQEEFTEYLNEKVQEGSIGIDAARAALAAVKTSGETMAQDQVETLAGKPKKKYRLVRQDDGTYDAVPIAEEQAAVDALDKLEQSTPEKKEDKEQLAAKEDLQAKKDRLEEINTITQDVPSGPYAKEAADLQREIDAATKKPQKKEDKKPKTAPNKKQPIKVEDAISQEGVDYVKVEGKWYRQKKNGEPYKSPIRDQSKFTEPTNEPVQKSVKESPTKESLPKQEVIEPDLVEITPLTYEKGQNMVEAKKVLDEYLGRKEEGTLLEGDENAARLAFQASAGTLPSRLRNQVRESLQVKQEETKEKKVVKRREKKEKRELSPETFEMTETKATTVPAVIDETFDYEKTDGKIEEGSVVEFEGDKFIVKEQKGGKYTLTSANGRGGAKGVTAKEISLLKVVPAKVGDKIIYEGKETSIKSQGDKVVLEDGTELTASPELATALTEAKALYKKKQKLEASKKRLTDSINDQRLGAFFDPKKEAYKSTEFFKALTDLAVSWIDYNGSVAYSRFKRSLPVKIRTKVADEIIREAFVNNVSYARQKLISEEKQAAQAEANIGNKTSQGAETLMNSELLTEEQKEEIKKKKWQYWNRSLEQSDDMAAAFINEVGLDQAYEDFINNRVPASIAPFVGKTLITMLNATNQSRKAAETAQKLVEIGQDFGRGLGAFRGLTQLDAEGLQIWAAKQVSTTSEQIKKRNARKVKIAVAKLENAKATVRGQDVTLFRKEEIKAKKDKAWQELKRAMLGNATSGVSPEVMKAAGKYAYYLVLSGVSNLDTLIRRMKSTPLSRQEITRLWNSPVAGDMTLNQVAQGQHLDAVSNALGTPKLAKVLEDLDVKNPAKTAAKLNKQFNKAVTTELKSQASSDVDKVLLKLQEDLDMKKVKGDLESMTKSLGVADLEAAMTVNPKLDQLVADAYGDMQKAPYDWMKVEIAKDFAVAIANEIGPVPFKSLAMSLWYASILSGPGTQVLNAGSNVLNTIAEGAVQTPITTYEAGLTGNAEAVKGLLRGWSKGLTEAREIWTKGVNPTRASNKFFEADPLERFEFDTKEFARIVSSGNPAKSIGYLLGGYPAIMKYVPRLMAATDAFFYHGLYEARASAYAAAGAAKVPKSQRKAEYARLLGWEGGVFKDSFETAKQEATQTFEEAGMEYSDADVRRSAREIIEKRSQVKDVAHRFASKGTFNYAPEGLLGVIANALSSFSQDVPAFRFIVPFTRIVANVLNEQLNYSPYGLKRAFVGSVTRMRGREVGEFSSNSKSSRESVELLFKASIGTFVLPMAAMLLAGEDEDELPLLAGRGPLEYTERKQLMDRGWKPYSIKIGDTWVNYQYSPASIPLTFLGNMFDLQRYTDQDDVEIFKKSIANIGPALFNMSFLKTFGELIAAFTEDDPNKSDLEYFVTAQAMKLPAGFIPNMIRSIDKATDPTYQQDMGWEERFMKQVPFLRRHVDRPALNVFGEPVKIKASGVSIFLGLNRFGSTDTSDGMTEVFSRKNYVLPGIGKSTEIDGVELKDSPEDYYDYALLVGRHFKKNFDVSNYESMTPEQFEKAVDKRWMQSRKIMQNLLPHQSVEQILKTYNLGKKPY